MLKSLLILHFFIVAIKANGEFTIVNIPKSLSFKGNEPIESHDIGEVVYVSLGNAISGDSEWSGLHIIDPFNLPQTAVVVTLNGVNHSNVSLAGKTYSIVGDMAEESLNGVTAQLEAENEPVCVISFEHFEEGKLSFRNAVGDVRIPSVANTRYLNGNLHIADKDYLESIALANAVADNLVNMEKIKFIYISLFIDAVAKSHGDNSDAINEALDLFTTAVKHLNKAAQKLRKNQVLFVAAVNKAGDNNRKKRDTDPSDIKEYNLAEYYSEDYPVVFNIILWFMVVFGLALLAICYAIGTMDPGRDSIIYRMTSTRMKKDN